jgi:hypothetical protein
MGQGMKKIAVVLRGHKRTWDLSKEHMFKFFEQMGCQVDYYVSLWNTPGVDRNQLTLDFANRNLKVLLITEPSAEYITPWLGPAYLSSLVSKYIFEEEYLSQEPYDMIVDTRPDVAFEWLPHRKKMFCPKMAVGTTRVEPVALDNGAGTLWQGLDDHCFIMDSITHVIWSQRFRFTHELQNQRPLPCGNHSMLWEYAKLYKIDSYVIPWFNSDLVRPSVINFKDSVFYNKSMSARHTWNMATKEEKRKFVIDAGVGEKDYEEAIQIYKEPQK